MTEIAKLIRVFVQFCRVFESLRSHPAWLLLVLSSPLFPDRCLVDN